MEQGNPTSSLRGVATRTNGRHTFVHERVLIVVAREKERHGWVSFRKLDFAKRLGCCEHSLDRAIAKLRRDGLIVSKPVFDERGAQLGNEYRATDAGIVRAEEIKRKSS